MKHRKQVGGLDDSLNLRQRRPFVIADVAPTSVMQLLRESELFALLG